MGSFKTIPVNSSGSLDFGAEHAGYASAASGSSGKQPKPVSRELRSLGSAASEKAQSSAKAADADDEDAVMDLAMFRQPVVSGLRTKNLLLLLKIVRSVVLRLGPDSQQLQITELDRCWQKDQSFHSWVEIYKERVQIAEAVGRLSRIPVFVVISSNV